MGFSGYMYRDVLLPVAECLVSVKGQECAVIYDEPHFRNALISMYSVRSESIWENWNSEVADDSRAFGRQLRAAIAEIEVMGALPQLVEAGKELMWPQMESGFNWLFHFHLPLLVPQIAIARHLLKKNRPQLIISADVADARVRLYSLLGRQLNIPTLEVQFGPNGAEGTEWRFLLAERVATWGETTLQALLKHGVSEHRITITGSPRHDSLVNIDPVKVEKMRSRLGIPAGYAMVLCASTYQQKEYNSLSDPELLVSMKRAVFKAAGKLQGMCLVVKPHPLEKVEETKQLIGSEPNIILVNPADDIRELIISCDAFLGFGSTATVDAMIADKLTICPAFLGWVWSNMFVTSNATMVPRTAEEVESSLRSVVDGSIGKVKSELQPARLIFLEKWVYKVDGHSAERTADMAMELAEESRRQNFCQSLPGKIKQ
jgi:hypothetical protein